MKSKYVIFLLAFVIVALLTVIAVGGLYLYNQRKDQDNNSGSSSSSVSSSELSSQSSNESSLNIDYSLEPAVYEKDTAEMPDYIQEATPGEGPWHNDIYMASSPDGLAFSNEKFFMSHAGVPNVIKTSDGNVIAVFQYFSFVNEDLFDKIVYTISEDGGATWSKIKMIEFSGLTEGAGKGFSANPVDPTLVELPDGSLRLYFTFQPPGDAFPGLYSAKTNSIDGTFVSEGKQLDVGHNGKNVLVFSS